MSEKFDKATELVKTLSSCSDANKLKFYGLFKQAKEGDNTKP